jgi:hypothetical protein
LSNLKRYQVASACVLIPVAGADGLPVISTLYRGSVFEADPDNVRVVHNVDSRYIVEIDADATPGVDVVGEPPVENERAVGDGAASDPPPPGDGSRPGQAATDVEAKRAAARAKLPTDGSAPDGRLGQDVWVEYAVSKGMDRAEAEKASKADLVAALKSA